MPALTAIFAKFDGGLRVFRESGGLLSNTPVQNSRQSPVAGCQLSVHDHSETRLPPKGMTEPSIGSPSNARPDRDFRQV